MPTRELAGHRCTVDLLPGQKPADLEFSERACSLLQCTLQKVQCSTLAQCREYAAGIYMC